MLLLFVIGLCLGIMFAIALAIKKDFFTKKSLFEALIPALILSMIVGYGLLDEYQSTTFENWVTNVFSVLVFMLILAYILAFTGKMRLGITRFQFLVGITMFTAYLLYRNTDMSIQNIFSLPYIMLIAILVAYIIITSIVTPNNIKNRKRWAFFNLIIFTALIFYIVFPFIFSYEIVEDRPLSVLVNGFLASFFLFVPVQSYWLITSSISGRSDWEKKLSKNILSLLEEDYYKKGVSSSVALVFLFVSLILFLGGLYYGLNPFSVSMGIIAIARISEETVSSFTH
ncbi:MAG: hypothetical protein ACMXYL_03730 [Candidatus Woesearchaeota archaeon]